jgi:tetratricopeptide (TPR) repeat protein
MLLNLLFIPSLLLLVAGETLAAKELWSALQGQPVETAKVFQYHLLGLLLGWPAFWKLFPADYRQHVITLTALIYGFSLPLPVIGPLLLVGFRIIIRREEADYAEASFVVGTTQFLTLPKDEEFEHESPRSVAQILNGNDQQARRAAILALRVVEPKKALPLLQRAIQDSDEQVRLLAQTLFSQIIANLEGEVKNLEAELSKNPHWSRQLLLAEQYHELVYLGLASNETEIIYLNRAIELLEAAQKIAPENTSIRFLLLKCLLRNGRHDEAEQRLRRLEALGWRSEITQPWSAEIQYLKRDWKNLRETLQRMRKSESTAPIMRGSIDFWTNPSRPDHA